MWSGFGARARCAPGIMITSIPAMHAILGRRKPPIWLLGMLQGLTAPEKGPTYPTETGLPCLCCRALPSRIPSTSPMGSCAAGGLEFGTGFVRGHKHVSGVRLITAPPIQACCQHAWCRVCGTEHPREEGLHDRWSVYTD